MIQCEFAGQWESPSVTGSPVASIHHQREGVPCVMGTDSWCMAELYSDKV